MPSDELIFRNPAPIERDHATAILAGDNPARIADTLVAVALHDPDREWIEKVCWRLAEHEDPSVRGIAGLCLGHVARRFGSVHAHSWKVARALCADPVADRRARDGLDDMLMYAGPGPPDG